MARQKKKRGRSRSKAAAGGVGRAPDSSGGPPAPPIEREQSASLAPAGQSSTAPSDYNDVFFQKRDEAAPAVAESAPSAASTEAVGAATVAPQAPEEGKVAGPPGPAPATGQQVSESPQSEHRGFLSRILGKLGRHNTNT